jgi:TRAP-type C4-dicarboxylate transport system permease small subunit
MSAEEVNKKVIFAGKIIAAIGLGLLVWSDILLPSLGIQTSLFYPSLIILIGGGIIYFYGVIRRRLLRRQEKEAIEAAKEKERESKRDS